MLSISTFPGLLSQKNKNWFQFNTETKSHWVAAAQPLPIKVDVFYRRAHLGSTLTFHRTRAELPRMNCIAFENLLEQLAVVRLGSTQIKNHCSILLCPDQLQQRTFS